MTFRQRLQRQAGDVSVQGVARIVTRSEVREQLVRLFEAVLWSMALRRMH